MGQSDPERFPIDDRHVARPVTPYSVAKLAGEEVLAGASRRTGLATLCLRFPRLTSPKTYDELLDRWSRGVAEETSPYWEYGAYLDVRDAAIAVAQACSVELGVVHDRVLLVDTVPAHVASLPELIAASVEEILDRHFAPDRVIFEVPSAERVQTIDAMARRLGVLENRRCVIVDDSARNLAELRRRGYRTLGVGGLISDRPMPADVIVNDLTELDDLLHDLPLTGR